MGTTLVVGAEADSREASLRSIDSAFAAVRRVDDVLNDWRDDTELASVNRAAPGGLIRPGPELWDYLAVAAEWTRRSGGAFDPGIGSLVDAWDMRGQGRIPSVSALQDARQKAGLLRFRFDLTSHTLERPAEGSWIDAGGFGKGAALKAAGVQLARHGARQAILNFGGQILALGDTVLVVEVAHPEHRLEPVASIRLNRASASTSSQSERFVDISGRQFGHLLDPRSGTPAPGWGSVTVIHPDPLLADILSTALFVLGPDEGPRWARDRDIAALFLVTRGDMVEARWSPAMQDHLITLPPISRGN